MLQNICFVYRMPPKRKASAGVAATVQKAKRGRGRKEGASGPAATPSGTATISNTIQLPEDAIAAIAARVLASIEQRLAPLLPANNAPVPPVHVQAVPVMDATVTAPTVILDQPSTSHLLVERETANIAGNHQSFFSSVSSALTANVPAKIKEAIWAGGYVDFSELSDSSLTSGGAVSGKVSMSLTDWSRTWNKFSAILTEKSPSLSPLLSHHMEVVMRIHSKGGNWAYYDKEFRALVSRGEAQWGATHLELFMNALIVENNEKGATGKGTQDNTSRQGKLAVPQGACYRYHRTGFCPTGRGCRYQHKCFNKGCMGDHPTSRCRLPLRKPYTVTRGQGQSFRADDDARDTEVVRSNEQRPRQDKRRRRRQ